MAFKEAGDAMAEMTFVEAAREGLDEEMARDATVFVMGQGIGARGGNFNTTLGLFEKYGQDRLRDVPIAERGFVGMCTGAAATGTRPVVDFMFVDFILDAMGELVNQTAKLQYMSSGRLKMPIVLRGCVGVGRSSATHHSGAYYPIFTHLPGFRVVVPTTPRDAKGLLKTAIRSDDPVIFLEHKSLLSRKGEVPEGEFLVPFGQAWVARQGRAMTVVAIGSMVPQTLEVADRLAAEGLDCEVIDPRTLAPLDMDTILESVNKTGRLLIVDETYAPCGIGAEIASQVADRGFDDLDAPIRRLNGRHTPVPYSPPLEAAIVPSLDNVAEAARALAAE
jgi:2-oxoisovalerate dehydrogenase E1 component